MAHVLRIVTSTLTACLSPNTCLSTPRPRYCVPKINTHTAEQLNCHLKKSLADTNPLEYVDTYSLLTGYRRPQELYNNNTYSMPSLENPSHLVSAVHHSGVQSPALSDEYKHAPNYPKRIPKSTYMYRYGKSTAVPLQPAVTHSCCNSFPDLI